MHQQTAVRAWRDPVFRAALSAEILERMPAHPIEDLAEDDLDWSVRLGAMAVDDPCAITFGGGCTSAGCSAIVCTDPCGTLGDSCPKRTEAPGCTLGSDCDFRK